MVLRRYVRHERDGFYIDIGAHHPFRFSNTAFFHSLGWRGLNVDANPAAIDLFRQYRPGDINVVAGVGKTECDEIFYLFNEPALNTFDYALAQERLRGSSDYEIVERRRIHIQPLSDLLDKWLPPDQHVDFLSVDVEGRDYDVLLSNDWERYRPDYVLVEMDSVRKMADVEKCNATIFLKTNGYRAVAKTLLTIIYENESVG